MGRSDKTYFFPLSRRPVSSIVAGEAPVRPVRAGYRMRGEDADRGMFRHLHAHVPPGKIRKGHAAALPDLIVSDEISDR